MELAKYNIDIRLLEYSFFWSGKPEGEGREAGVGFAIKKDIVTKLTEMPQPVSDRIMMIRLPQTKFSKSGSLNDLEYSFFWSGKPEGERREAGVGFAIKENIVTK